MFRQREQHISTLLNGFLREKGLESPLLQHRLINAWEEVVGPTAAAQTSDKYIKNQTLFVKITSPALRQELSLCATDIIQRLNAKAGGQVITTLHTF